jgi:ribosomal protein S27AE
MSMTDERLRELLHEWRDDGSITELIDEVIDLRISAKQAGDLAADYKLAAEEYVVKWAEERDKVVLLRKVIEERNIEKKQARTFDHDAILEERCGNCGAPLVMEQHEVIVEATCRCGYSYEAANFEYDDLRVYDEEGVVRA